MTRDKLIRKLTIIMEIWAKESKHGLEMMKGSEYWEGYHRGQLRVAENVLKILEEER